MDRIATSTSYQSALLSILNAQAKQADAQARVSTGFVGNDLKAYAGQADTLTAAKTVNAKLDAYAKAADRAADRLSTQDLALNGVSDAAAGVKQGVLAAVANADGGTLMATLQGWFAQAADSLNTSVGGDYVFAGGQTSTKPVASDQLSDLAAGTVASKFANDQLRTTARLDDNVTLTTGVLASDVATPLFGVLQQIAQYDAGSNGPFGSPLTTAQTAFLTSILPNLGTVASGAVGQVAANAVAQTRVSNAQSQLADRKTASDQIVGKVAEADPAKAAIDLNLASTALQASAQVFSVLKGSSLLNILTS